MAMNVDDFRKSLLKVVKRETVARGFEQGKTLSEIKQALKDVTQTADLQIFLDTLLSSTTVVEKRRAAVVEELVEVLRQKFKIPNLCIVLMGSAVHGGGELRRLTDNPGEVDLDWGVASDGKALMDFQLRLVIKNEAARLIPDLGKRHGLGNELHSCTKYHGGNYFFFNFESEQECIDRIKAQDVHNRAGLMVDLIAFFQPTFPADVGERNREILLNSLRTLHQTEPYFWKAITDGMKREWRENHKLKTKHMVQQKQPSLSLSFDRTLGLVDQLESEDVTSEPFYKLIDSTGAQP